MTSPSPTILLQADAPGIARAAALMRRGALVALPTETVYGLGADARDPRAVAALFAAKGRPAANPLIVHVADLAAARALADLSPQALALAAAFWPGPLTLVAPLRPGAGLAAAVTAGLATVALRVPAHPVARALIAAFGGPVAAPSANPSGGVSPTTAAHVLAGLGGRIAAVLQGGPCAIGLESTIVGCDGPPRLLRPGGLGVEAIEALIGPLAPAPPGISAPGQSPSHYAPGARLRLDATAPRPGEAWLGFGPDPGPDHGAPPSAAAPGGPAPNPARDAPAPHPSPALSLSPTGDLGEAAANLFAHLRALDAALGGLGTIAVAPIPDHGLGRALNDRLRRAAAPRG